MMGTGEEQDIGDVFWAANILQGSIQGYHFNMQGKDFNIDRSRIRWLVEIMGRTVVYFGLLIYYR